VKVGKRNLALDIFLDVQFTMILGNFLQKGGRRDRSDPWTFTSLGDCRIGAGQTQAGFPPFTDPFPAV
jgi:hypothetical protein